MHTGIYENESNFTDEYHSDGHMSERRLWAAVILQALEDWQSGSVRRRTEAENFFFDSDKDFATVCTRAGLNPESVREKLKCTRPALRQPWGVALRQVA
jgi:hypothetical protein